MLSNPSIYRSQGQGSPGSPLCQHLQLLHDSESTRPLTGFPGGGDGQRHAVGARRTTVLHGEVEPCIMQGVTLAPYFDKRGQRGHPL